jgi:hypothetical protein
VLAGHFDHAPALDKVVRSRLFDVNVLAGLAGPDGGQRVPVIRGGNGDRGDVLVLQDAANVLFDAWGVFLPGVDGLLGVGNDVVVDIADVSDVDVLEGRKAANEVAATAANALTARLTRLLGCCAAPSAVAADSVAAVVAPRNWRRSKTGMA